MKAISLHAPWGTLLHTRKTPTHDCHDFVFPCPKDEVHSIHPPMVKRFETRSWPCPPSIIGQRIAIHQAKREPSGMVGDWRVIPWLNMDGGSRRRFTLFRYESMTDVPLPLGCIVASGVITRSLLIVGHDCNNRSHVCHVHGGGLLRHLDLLGPDDDTEWDITDQLPYGDWSPGRWAWELSDVAATIERCPTCWGAGSAAPDWEEWDQRYTWGNCDTCEGVGVCDPIPTVGRQRFWNWNP